MFTGDVYEYRQADRRGVSRRTHPHRGVASLSMMSTPNRGSAIADFLVCPAPSPLYPRWITCQTLVQLAVELNLPVGALGNLTGAYANMFNAQNPKGERWRGDS
jgi:hypothetical protein